LLSAKFQIPAINKNIISRERVLQKLQKAPECKLTLITAPAGYGKTHRYPALAGEMRVACGVAVAGFS
jgi:ATP/maltotriose-dependent transcriptional regulator MalT